MAPPGGLTITTDAVIEDSGLPDPVKLDARELADIAWRHFGSSPRG